MLRHFKTRKKHFHRDQKWTNLIPISKDSKKMKYMLVPRHETTQIYSSVKCWTICKGSEFKYEDLLNITLPQKKDILNIKIKILKYIKTLPWQLKPTFDYFCKSLKDQIYILIFTQGIIYQSMTMSKNVRILRPFWSSMTF